MQYAPSGYVGCWSRLEGVTRSRVTRALERRQVVQATLLRSTIHLVSAADYPVMFEATRASRRDNGVRAARMRKLDALDYGAVAAQVRGWFGDGPLGRSELLDRLAAEGIDAAYWETLSQWLELLRVPPQGTWQRRRAHLYGLARHELPGSSAPVDPDAAMELLVHARRTQILPEHHRDRVFHIRRPHSVNTVLSTGRSPQRGPSGSRAWSSSRSTGSPPVPRRAGGRARRAGGLRDLTVSPAA